MPKSKGIKIWVENIYIFFTKPQIIIKLLLSYFSVKERQGNSLTQVDTKSSAHETALVNCPWRKSSMSKLVTFTCGNSFFGSALLSIARTNAAVLPVPDWLCAIRFWGLKYKITLLTFVQTESNWLTRERETVKRFEDFFLT